MITDNELKKIINDSPVAEDVIKYHTYRYDSCVTAYMCVSNYNESYEEYLHGYFSNEYEGGVFAPENANENEKALYKRIKGSVCFDGLNIHIEDICKDSRKFFNCKKKIEDEIDNASSNKERKKLMSSLDAIKYIQEVWIGPTIKSYDLINNKMTHSTIIETEIVGNDDLFKITVFEGNSLIVSNNTKLLTSNGFKAFKDINRDTTIMMLEPPDLRVKGTYCTSTTPLKIRKPIYSLRTSGGKNIHPIVDGFIVKQSAPKS